MQPTLVREPFHRAGWVYEEKVDIFWLWVLPALTTVPLLMRHPDYPPPLMTFDLLYRNGHDLSARPLRDRRARLEDVVAGSELVFPHSRGWPGVRGVHRAGMVSGCACSVLMPMLGAV